MALKFKITKGDYDKLSDELKAEYTLVGNDATLDVDGGPDPKAGDKFTAERDRRRAAEKRATEAEAKIVELEDQFGDTKTTIAKAEKKASDAEKKFADAETKHQTYVKSMLIDKVASDLANGLSKTAPKLLMPHIKSRLGVDFSGDEPKTVVLGADGKPSDLDTEKLAKEFRDNKDFAAIIVASHASGGGASRHGPANGNGLPGGGGSATPPALSSLSAKDMAAHITAQRQSKGLEVAG